jgi:hypothetical protein
VFYWRFWQTGIRAPGARIPPRSVPIRKKVGLIRFDLPGFWPISEPGFIHFRITSDGLAECLECGDFSAAFADKRKRTAGSRFIVKNIFGATDCYQLLLTVTIHGLFPPSKSQPTIPVPTWILRFLW